MAERKNGSWDCVIVGAGPGGLQAAIYLARYNRRVLVLDRGGGRTSHAVHVENVFGHPLISGRELIEIGKKQALAFGVAIERGTVTRVRKKERGFRVETKAGDHEAPYVIASSGARENLMQIRNLPKFFAKSFYTCVDCDGYRTRGKTLLLIGNTFHTVRLAFAMKEMFTKDVTVLLVMYDPPPDVREELVEEGIALIQGRPGALLGGDTLEGIELEDGRQIACEAILSDFGYKLNDDYLADLDLKKDGQNFKYVTNRFYESSVRGLYILGPLTANDQIVIAAGAGALAAIDIKKNFLEI